MSQLGAMSSASRTALWWCGVALTVTACGAAAEPQGTAASTGGPTAPATATTAQSDIAPAAPGVPDGEQLRVRVTDRRPHDPTAFTQGLEFDDGRLFESRGLYDEDVVLTQIDPADGTAIEQVMRDPGEEYFAEGLTVVGDRLIQLTWRAGMAFVYDVDTLERTGTFTYQGEGWGLCDQPDRLVMSDGTATLTFRDPVTFEATGTVTVTLDGEPVERLNELECVDGMVWANVWQTDSIVVVDPADGAVTSVVDASGLLTPEEAADADVLNGIAYDPDGDTWLLTGKRWPWMFEVTFDCVDGCDSAQALTHYVRVDRRTLAGFRRR